MKLCVITFVGPTIKEGREKKNIKKTHMQQSRFKSKPQNTLMVTNNHQATHLLII